MTPNICAVERLRSGANKCPGKCLSHSPGLPTDWSRPMHHNARPLPPYNPERVFREETGVLVFHDVPEDEWITTARGIDFNVWADETAAAAARTDELRRMPYKDYLKTPEWARLRRLVMARSDGVCGRCRRKADVWNVHHLTYERLGCELMTDLVLLCRRCHQAVHGIEDH